MNDFYEHHPVKDGKLPILYRVDFVDRRDAHTLLHWHENIEFLYITGEEAIINVGGEVFPAHHQELVVVNSCQIHDLYSLNTNTELFCLVVDKGLCENLGFSITEKNILKKIKDPKISYCMENIKEELLKKEAFYKDVVLGYIRTLLSYCYRRFETTPYASNKATNADIVKSAIEFMQRSYYSTIFLEDIADAVQYNKFYLEKLFRQVTGLSVLSYLTHLRVSKAKEFLCQNSYSLEQISLKCGFANQSYFTKVFKKYTGTTPKKYKDQNHKLS